MDHKVVPIVVKSGKAYYRHNALSNIKANPLYGIEEAIVFHDGNLKKEGRVIYAPLYMTMMLKKEERKPIPIFFDASELIRQLRRR